jgi:hypothetical protein
MTNTSATQVGLLAIAMQRAYNRVLAWCEAQADAGIVVTLGQAPDWEVFEIAKAAFTQALTAAAQQFQPATDTAIGLAETAKGVRH